MKTLPRLALACTLVFAAFAARAAAEPIHLTFTFDDNVKDHLTVAAPELEKRGWRGLFCVVTDWVGGGPRALSWDDVRELVKRGHEIATHTLTHPSLKALVEKGATNEVRRQIVESTARIEKETGVRPRFLCLPGTQYAPEVGEIARQAGLETMLVPRQCYGDFPNDPLRDIARMRRQGKTRTDFLVHGIRPKDPSDPAVGGGWKPFPSREAYCAFLDKVKQAESAGDVTVGPYGR